MISKYVKEQKRYTQDELRKIFECTADETVQIIRKLKEYGIVKNVKKSDVFFKIFLHHFYFFEYGF